MRNIVNGSYNSLEPVDPGIEGVEIILEIDRGCLTGQSVTPVRQHDNKIGLPGFHFSARW